MPMLCNSVLLHINLLLSKTYATALLYYFVLNATKLTKNLLLFAKLLYMRSTTQSYKEYATAL